MLEKCETTVGKKVLTLTVLVSSSVFLGDGIAIAIVDAAASTAIGAGKLAVK